MARGLWLMADGSWPVAAGNGSWPVAAGNGSWLWLHQPKAISQKPSAKAISQEPSAKAISQSQARRATGTRRRSPDALAARTSRRSHQPVPQGVRKLLGRVAAGVRLAGNPLPADRAVTGQTAHERMAVQLLRRIPRQPRQAVPSPGGGKVESAVGTPRGELWDFEHFEDRNYAQRRLKEFHRAVASAARAPSRPWRRL
jgi:hypothetical protein